MTITKRPLPVKVFTALLILSAALMTLLGISASAYFVPALCLALQGVLLWHGRGFPAFKWIILLNQLSALVLILVLGLGDGLGDTKLDIAGVMLLLNLLCGGPLMSVFAVPIMLALHRGKRLFVWFHPQTA